jgi:hypothetical protein
VDFFGARGGARARALAARARLFVTSQVPFFQNFKTVQSNVHTYLQA